MQLQRRFVVVIADATEEDALCFLEQAILPGITSELVYFREIAGSAEFVKSEIKNNRQVDAVFFVSNNLHQVPAIGEVIATLDDDPITEPIYAVLCHGKMIYDINHRMDMEEQFSRGPTPQLDFLRRRLVTRKPPNYES